MKNWILNFINDERGAESVELGITGAVVAGGAVAGFSLVKGKVIEKQEELVDKLDESTAEAVAQTPRRGFAVRSRALVICSLGGL